MSGDKRSDIADTPDDTETSIKTALGPQQMAQLLIRRGQRQFDTCLKALIPLVSGQLQSSFKWSVDIHGRLGLQTRLSET